MQSYVVYYLHFKDDRFMEPNFNKNKDYCACVMAENQEEAIKKTQIIAARWCGDDHIKIMGIAKGHEDWVDEEKPLGVGNNFMPLGGWNRQRA
jgi:hypothetical protein